MRTIVISSLLFAGIISFGQGHIIKKLSIEDGLMLDRVSGGFQDDRGVVWIANGMGFTRFYGDHYDQVKGEMYVFEWTPLNHIVKVANNKYYWSL